MHKVLGMISEIQASQKLSVLQDFHTLRESMTWGTYGKCGTLPLEQVRIAHMDLEHIEAVLATQHQMAADHRTIMEQELKYRESI